MCSQCRELLAYAEARLERCPFGLEKPTCSKCPIHCYKPDMREEIREVMSYAGPRMLKKHPVLGIRHLIDGRKKVKSPAPFSTDRSDASSGDNSG